jgi:hypothetical protein
MNYLSKVLTVCVSGILLFAGLSTIGLSMSHEMDRGLSEDDKMLYGFINRQGSYLGEKYHMWQSATGIGGMDKIWLMALSFERYGDPLTEEEARKLIINCVDDFLDAVNRDEQLKPFLKDHPFTAKNLDLDIFNYGKDQVSHYFPYISVVSDSRGKIGFFTEEASIEYGFYTKKYETYDEAVAILKRK